VNRTYEYQGFTVELGVESDFSWRHGSTPLRQKGFAATARIFQAGKAVVSFSPLRFGDFGGRPFATDTDALWQATALRERSLTTSSASKLTNGVLRIVASTIPAQFLPKCRAGVRRADKIVAPFA
jgi:hypothetical protein